MAAVSPLAALRRTFARNEPVLGPIGIDIGLQAVHFVQLQAQADGIPTVRARVSVPFDGGRRELLGDPARLRSIVKGALAGGDFSARKAVVAVPSGMFRTMSINYHGVPDQSDAASVLRIMTERLDGPLSDFVIDYLPVKAHSKDNERLALVAVSERDTVIGLLETLRKARLDVAALEIGPVAISRLIGVLPSGEDSSNVLVINSGRDASYLTLICGSDLLFDQRIGFGENSLVRELADTLDLSVDMARGLMERSGVAHGGAAADDADVGGAVTEILRPQFLQLVEEIRRVCMYAAAETRGGTVGQAYLLGSIARWPGAAKMLGAMTEVPVANVPDPLCRMAEGEDVDAVARSPEIAVATGLALRGMLRHG